MKGSTSSSSANKIGPIYFSVTWKSDNEANTNLPPTKYYKWTPPQSPTWLFAIRTLSQDYGIAPLDIHCKTVLSLVSLANGKDYGILPRGYVTKVMAESIASGMYTCYDPNSTTAQNMLQQQRHLKIVIGEDEMGQVEEIINPKIITATEFQECIVCVETLSLISESFKVLEKK